MKSKIKKCLSCNRYTMKEKCPICNAGTVTTIPMRFSPKDKYGKYRRKFYKFMELERDIQ